MNRLDSDKWKHLQLLIDSVNIPTAGEISEFIMEKNKESKNDNKKDDEVSTSSEDLYLEDYGLME